MNIGVLHPPLATVRLVTRSPCEHLHNIHFGAPLNASFYAEPPSWTPSTGACVGCLLRRSALFRSLAISGCALHDTTTMPPNGCLWDLARSLAPRGLRSGFHRGCEGLPRLGTSLVQRNVLKQFGSTTCATIIQCHMQWKAVRGQRRAPRDQPTLCPRRKCSHTHTHKLTHL